MPIEYQGKVIRITQLSALIKFFSVLLFLKSVKYSYQKHRHNKTEKHKIEMICINNIDINLIYYTGQACYSILKFLSLLSLFFIQLLFSTIIYSVYYHTNLILYALYRENKDKKEAILVTTDNSVNKSTTFRMHSQALFQN